MSGVVPEKLPALSVIDENEHYRVFGKLRNSFPIFIIDRQINS